MVLHDVRLSDRYDLTKPQVLLSGTQALVRLTLIQRARDQAAGLNTAGYVTGYRGSPLGAVDGVFQAAGRELGEANVTFHPGLNEDLAATAIWGAQTAEVRGEGKYDGVFGLWYGKGPGVDRSGDVFRHANLAGTSPKGGVLVAMGDDHTGESSTTLHQSEMAMMDAYIPVLSPAGVQELLDYGVLGWAMSRFSGCWVGLKCMKDTVEATSVVDGRPERIEVATPAFDMPPGGLNIRAYEEPWQSEERLHDYKRDAVLAFARANGLDRRVHGKAGAKIGIVSAGKSWMDVVHALDLLGIDAEMAGRIGLTTYKVGMTWPLDPLPLMDWAEGLDLIIVVEEKRPIIETQLKEILFDQRSHARVVGHKDQERNVLFTVKKGLDPVTIARGIGGQMTSEGVMNETITERLGQLNEAVKADNQPELAQRTPWFCAGCPHNTGTQLQEGARAYSGIGCHYMVQWMDRETLGYTHMGGEGANWIGEAPFSTRAHVFQNLGDGTYNHSGIQAIRAAVGAGTNITFKILYNDAVAMTGGQSHDGGIGPRRIVDELIGIGVGRVEVVADEKEDVPSMPSGMKVHPAEISFRFKRSWSRSMAPPPSSISRPAPQRNVAAANVACSPISTSGSSSTPASARAAAIAGSSRTVSRSCRWRHLWAASARSTKAPATKISRVSRASAPASSPLRVRSRKNVQPPSSACPSCPSLRSPHWIAHGTFSSPVSAGPVWSRSVP